jgi:hypothetical protein
MLLQSLLQIEHLSYVSSLFKKAYSNVTNYNVSNSDKNAQMLKTLGSITRFIHQNDHGTDKNITYICNTLLVQLLF